MFPLVYIICIHTYTFISMPHSLSSATENNSSLCLLKLSTNLDINHFYLIFSFVYMYLCVHVMVRRKVGCCSLDIIHLLLETRFLIGQECCHVARLAGQQVPGINLPPPPISSLLGLQVHAITPGFYLHGF